MKKISKIIAVILCAVTPLIASAASIATSERTLSGSVIVISGSQITFSNSTAGVYTVQTSGAKLVRRNGSPMQLSEMLVGDKVQVTGNVLPDSNVAGSTIRDLSLYTHKGSIGGKITTVNANGFTLQGAPGKVYNVHTDINTAFKKNSTSATLADMQVGMTATVQALWDRNSTDILARDVKAVLHLVQVYFTGKLMIRVRAT